MYKKLKDLAGNPYLYPMRFIRADKIFDGKQFLPDTTVLALNAGNGLEALVPVEELDAGKIERLDGILTPGFVNSHCHLELSHMKGLIPQGTGLPAFGKQVILLRNSFTAEEQLEHMQAADRAMWQNGIVAVGDISNTAASFPQKAGSPIFYHTFLELIGLDPARAALVFEQGLLLEQELRQAGLSGSLAPHAPYSTSAQLTRMIAAHDAAQQLPLSIHNQESDEETHFFMGRKSAFEDLYNFLKLDISWFIPPGRSSLAEIAPALSGARALLVHNTVTSAGDLAAVSQAMFYWCFCPAANLYIESRLPDFDLFRGLESRICIGTDSLASNGGLDLLKEISTIRSATPAFSTEALLSAITANGAEALGISDRFGSLQPGKNTGLNLITEQNSEFRFVKKIT